MRPSLRRHGADRGELCLPRSMVTVAPRNDAPGAPRELRSDRAERFGPGPARAPHRQGRRDAQRMVVPGSPWVIGDRSSIRSARLRGPLLGWAVSSAGDVEETP